MNEICRECGGECCKWIMMRIPEPVEGPRVPSRVEGQRVSPSPGWIQWAELHGGVLHRGEFMFFPVRCGELTECGACGIYARRPQMCAEFEVGGDLCNLVREMVGKPPVHG